nr:hydroxyproline-rich glycoprotein family protein [Tanacetum cinerariifolium]
MKLIVRQNLMRREEDSVAVVIDTFRLINPQTLMLGQEPCQTTFNHGYLSKPSFQGIRVIHRAGYATTDGLFFQRPVFSHGQLYAPISLVKILYCDRG